MQKLLFSVIDTHVYLFQKVNIGLLERIQPSFIINFGSSTNDKSSSKKDTNRGTNCNESSTKDNNLFECPKEACICSFFKYGNLLRHLSIGHHRKMFEKTSLIDTAKKLYHSKLETSGNRRVISLSLEHSTFDSSDLDRLPQLNMGWGLPVLNAPVRFTVKQKQFLDVSYC